MATSGKSKMLILLTMATFGLAILGMYYNSVLDTGSSDHKKGGRTFASVMAAIMCIGVLMFGLTVKPGGFGFDDVVGVRGNGLGHAVWMMAVLITVVVTTGITWDKCVGSDDECQKDQRLGFYLLAGFALLGLIMFFSVRAKSVAKTYAQQQLA